MKPLYSFFSKNLKVILFLGFVFILSGCAETIDLNSCLPEKIHGFWWGMLHGFISLFTFIISLFDEEVAMYAVNNNGGWYDFGFILGVSMFFGGGSKASSKKK